MIQEVSIPALVADLERQIEHCRRMQAEHAEQAQHHLAQAELHRNEGERMAADLVTLEERYRSFRAAAEQASELAGRYAPAPEPAEPPPPEPAEAADPKPVFSEKHVDACRGPRGNLRVSRLLMLLIQARPEDEPFGAKALIEELGTRFRPKLSLRVDPRVVGQQLRRLAARGEIGSVRAGGPYHEALYRRRR
jgi:hypothetical protein